MKQEIIPLNLAWVLKAANILSARMWFILEPHKSIKETVNVILSNPGLKEFIKGLHWFQLRFFVKIVKKSRF